MQLKTAALASILICSAPLAHAVDGWNEGWEPGAYVSFGFGGSQAKPVSDLHYGFRMDFRSDTLRRLTGAPLASDLTLRDEVRTLSAVQVPSMLKLDFTEAGFRQANLGGVPLRQQKLKLMQDEETVDESAEGDEMSEEEGSGPMGVSWWWWGLGAVVVAGGAYYLLDDDDEEAAPAGTPPPAEEEPDCLIPIQDPLEPEFCLLI